VNREPVSPLNELDFVNWKWKMEDAEAIGGAAVQIETGLAPSLLIMTTTGLKAYEEIDY
jgi:hypothetical protein